jgi:rhodanese-related sulfurtransferase
MNRRSALLLLAGAGGVLAAPPAKELTPEELSKLLEKRENLFFLDVREPSEIAQLGSIKGYVNIPLNQLEGRLSEIPRNKLIVTT